MLLVHFDFPINPRNRQQIQHIRHKAQGRRQQRKRVISSLPQMNECLVWQMAVEWLWAIVYVYTAPPSFYHRRQRTRNGIAVDAITHYYLTFIFIDLFCDHDIYLLISTVVKFKLFIQRDCNLIHSNESLLLVQQSEKRALGTQLYAHRKLKNCTENHKMLLTLFECSSSIVRRVRKQCYRFSSLSTQNCLDLQNSTQCAKYSWTLNTHTHTHSRR